MPFAISPESRSYSPRNRFRVHPGIPFALLRIPQVTDTTTAAVERSDYLPFGEVLGVGASSPRNGIAGYGTDLGLRLKFTGKERDAETGLDYFGARYFSGVQGRFTSVD